MSGTSGSVHSDIGDDAPQSRKKKRRKSSASVLHKALKYIESQKQSKLRRLLSKHEALFSAGDHALLQELLHAACVQPSGAAITRMLLRCGDWSIACNNNNNLFCAFCRRGACANIPSPTGGRTPAHVAAAAGCLEVLAVLMAHHTAPDLDAVDASGRTVFAYTAEAMEARGGGGLTAARQQHDDGWADKLAGACSDPEQHERCALMVLYTRAFVHHTSLGDAHLELL